MGDQEAPVTISIVGTGTGDGGGSAPTPNGTIATTPGSQPDLRINVVTPTLAILVRFGHLFLTAFFGALGADGAGNVVGVDLFSSVGVVKAAALLGTSTAVAGLGKDLVTIFGRLEGKFPLMSGSI